MTDHERKRMQEALGLSAVWDYQLVEEVVAIAEALRKARQRLVEENICPRCHKACARTDVIVTMQGCAYCE